MGALREVLRLRQGSRALRRSNEEAGNERIGRCSGARRVMETERSQAGEAGAIGLVVRMELSSRGEDGGISGVGRLRFGESWEQVHARLATKTTSSFLGP
jgi:hypothetical protein